MYRTLAGVIALCIAASAARGQTVEQRLWRLSAGAATAQGAELLAAAYQPGPHVHAAVDFVARTTSTVRSIGYFVEYSRFAYDEGSFWSTVRNANGGTGGTVFSGAAAGMASVGAVGKFGPVYGRVRPQASLVVGLFRNSRGDLTMPGLNPGEETRMKLGSKSGALAGAGVSVDLMGRRFGVTADAGYRLNWSSSRLDKRFMICDGASCEPAAATSRTLVLRMGVALVRGQSG